MDDMSYFESRSGKLSCTAEEIFNFVTDIRNFEQFLPKETFKNWQAEKESACLNVPMLGTVSFRLAEKEMYNKVVYSGDALNKNDFSLVLHISDNKKNPAEVKISINADLNPMLKMMAAKPIGQFMEKLINEMEVFRGWKNTKE
jgi:carbon monoxide dehydrogenase subunit G